MNRGDQIASLYASVGADVSDFKRGLGTVKTGLTDLSGQMTSAVKLAGGLGAALVGAFATREIIDNTRQFAKQLTNIQSLGGRTAEDMNKLRDSLLDAGKNTFLEGGAQAAVSAFYDIASGVQGAAKQQAIFDAAIATAEAGQANLTATTGGLVSVMNSYGLEAKDATKVSDIFTRTVGLGVGTMDQFVAALSPIANLAATAGVSFQELGTTAAFLTSKGATTGDAATEIQSALVALLKPTDAMEEALKGLGYSAEGLIKEFGLVGAIEKLKGTTDGSASSLTALFGRVEALKGVLAVTGKDFGKFADSFKDGLKGATEAAREIQRNSPEAKIAKFGNQLNALGIKIGSKLLPPLGDLAELLGTIIDKAEEVLKPIKDVIGAIASPLIEKGKKAFTTFTDQWGDFVNNVKKFGLGTALESALNLGDGKKYMSGWIQGVLEALGMDKGLAGEIVTNIRKVLLVGLSIFEEFQHGIQTFISDIQNYGLAEAIIGAFGLGKIGADFGGESWIQGMINGIIQSIGELMPELSRVVRGIAESIGTFIVENAPKVNEAFQTLIGGVGEWLGSDGPGELVKGLTNLVKGAAEWIANTGWPMFRTGFIAVVDGIKTFIEGPGVQKFLNGLLTLFNNAKNWLLNDGVRGFINGLVGIGKGIYEFFTGSGWVNFRTGLVDAFNKAAVWIATVGVPKLVQAFSGLITEIANTLSNIPQMIKDALSGGGVTYGKINTVYPTKAPVTRTVKGKGFTPFREGGFAPIGTKFMAGEAGPELGIVGATGTTFKPMYSGASAGGVRNVNINLTVIDRDLGDRVYDVLATALRGG